MINCVLLLALLAEVASENELVHQALDSIGHNHGSAELDSTHGKGKE